MHTLILSGVLLISLSDPLRPKVQAASQTSGEDRPASATLGSLRDRYRPLLVFAATDRDERFVKQAKLLADGAASLHERQVLFMPLTLVREAGPARVVSVESADLSLEDAASARRRFDIAPGEFAVILIGKDGGEKFRAHTPVTIDRLNLVIDAMPMRQEELRNGNSK